MEGLGIIQALRASVGNGCVERPDFGSNRARTGEVANSGAVQNQVCGIGGRAWIDRQRCNVATPNGLDRLAAFSVNRAGATGTMSMGPLAVTEPPDVMVTVASPGAACIWK